MFSRNQVKEAILAVLTQKLVDASKASTSAKHRVAFRETGDTTSYLANDVRNHLGIEFPYSAAANRMLSNARIRLACRELEKEGKIEDRGRKANVAFWVVVTKAEAEERKTQEAERALDEAAASLAIGMLRARGFTPIESYHDDRVILSGRQMKQLLELALRGED